MLVGRAHGFVVILLLMNSRIFDPPEDKQVHRFSRNAGPTSKRAKDHTFGFDKVFDENITQGDVYEATTKNCWTAYWMDIMLPSLHMEPLDVVKHIPSRTFRASCNLTILT